MEPCVSIITPYYNTGPIFEETAGAVLAQTLRAWEWVIVNDGSTAAATLEVLAPLRRCDPRIRVIDQPNQGLPGARNAGVAATRAPLLFFLDSDDLIAPTMLEKLAWLLHSDEQAAFATAWVQAFGAHSYRWERGFESRTLFLFENTATPLSLVRRAVFEAAGGFNAARTGGLEDYEFWLRCASLGFWGRDLPEPLNLLRIKTPEQYAGYSWPTRDDRRHFRAFQREMRARYPQVYRRGLPLLPRLARCGPGPVPLDPPFANPWADAAEPHLLLLLPPLDHRSAPLLALLDELTQHMRCTVCATGYGEQPLFEEYARRCDTFVLQHFLQPRDHPRFLRYLAESRHCTAALIVESPFTYELLAYLRASRPQLLLADLVSGSPVPDPSATRLLDLRVAATSLVRRELLAQGLPSERAPLCATPQEQAAALARLVGSARIPRSSQVDALDPHAAAGEAVALLCRSLPAPDEPAALWRSLARERLMLWAYPLTRALRDGRWRLVQHPAWTRLRPAWHMLRRAVRRV